VTGLINQELLLKNEYLAAENRILRAHHVGVIGDGRSAVTVSASRHKLAQASPVVIDDSTPALRKLKPDRVLPTYCGNSGSSRIASGLPLRGAMNPLCCFAPQSPNKKSCEPSGDHTGRGIDLHPGCHASAAPRFVLMIDIGPGVTPNPMVTYAISSLFETVKGPARSATFRAGPPIAGIS
jgi:hypothetical protein